MPTYLLALATTSEHLAPSEYKTTTKILIVLYNNKPIILTYLYYSL